MSEKTKKSTLISITELFGISPESALMEAKKSPVGTVKLVPPKKGLPPTQVWVKMTDTGAKQWKYWKMITDPLASGLTDGAVVHVSDGKVIGKFQSPADQQKFLAAQGFADYVATPASEPPPEEKPAKKKGKKAAASEPDKIKAEPGATKNVEDFGSPIVKAALAKLKGDGATQDELLKAAVAAFSAAADKLLYQGEVLTPDQVSDASKLDDTMATLLGPSWRSMLTAKYGVVKAPGGKPATTPNKKLPTDWSGTVGEYKKSFGFEPGSSHEAALAHLAVASGDILKALATLKGELSGPAALDALAYVLAKADDAGMHLSGQLPDGQWQAPNEYYTKAAGFHPDTFEAQALTTLALEQGNVTKAFDSLKGVLAPEDAHAALTKALQKAAEFGWEVKGELPDAPTTSTSGYENIVAKEQPEAFDLGSDILSELDQIQADHAVKDSLYRMLKIIGGRPEGAVAGDIQAGMKHAGVKWDDFQAAFELGVQFHLITMAPNPDNGFVIAPKFAGSVEVTPQPPKADSPSEDDTTWDTIDADEAHQYALTSDEEKVAAKWFAKVPVSQVAIEKLLMAIKAAEKTQVGGKLPGKMLIAHAKHLGVTQHEFIKFVAALDVSALVKYDGTSDTYTWNQEDWNAKAASLNEPVSSNVPPSGDPSWDAIPATPAPVDNVADVAAPLGGTWLNQIDKLKLSNTPKNGAATHVTATTLIGALTAAGGTLSYKALAGVYKHQYATAHKWAGADVPFGKQNFRDTLTALQNAGYLTQHGGTISIAGPLAAATSASWDTTAPVTPEKVNSEVAALTSAEQKALEDIGLGSSWYYKPNGLLGAIKYFTQTNDGASFEQLFAHAKLLGWDKAQFGEVMAKFDKNGFITTHADSVRFNFAKFTKPSTGMESYFSEEEYNDTKDAPGTKGELPEAVKKVIAGFPHFATASAWLASFLFAQKTPHGAFALVDKQKFMAFAKAEGLFYKTLTQATENLLAAGIISKGLGGLRFNADALPAASAELPTDHSKEVMSLKPLSPEAVKLTRSIGQWTTTTSMKSVSDLRKDFANEDLKKEFGRNWAEQFLKLTGFKEDEPIGKFGLDAIPASLTGTVEQECYSMGATPAQAASDSNFAAVNDYLKQQYGDNWLAQYKIATGSDGTVNPLKLKKQADNAVPNPEYAPTDFWVPDWDAIPVNKDLYKATKDWELTDKEKEDLKVSWKDGEFTGALARALKYASETGQEIAWPNLAGVVKALGGTAESFKKAMTALSVAGYMEMGLSKYYWKPQAAPAVASGPATPPADVATAAADAKTLATFLKAMGFADADEATQKTMLKDPTFTKYVIQTFGAGWYEKWKAGQGETTVPKAKPSAVSWATVAANPAIPTAVIPDDEYQALSKKIVGAPAYGLSVFLLQGIVAAGKEGLSFADAMALVKAKADNVTLDDYLQTVENAKKSGYVKINNGKFVWTGSFPYTPPTIGELNPFEEKAVFGFAKGSQASLGTFQHIVGILKANNGTLAPAELVTAMEHYGYDKDQYFAAMTVLHSQGAVTTKAAKVVLTPSDEWKQIEEPSSTSAIPAKTPPGLPKLAPVSDPKVQEMMTAAGTTAVKAGGYVIRALVANLAGIDSSHLHALAQKEGYQLFHFHKVLHKLVQAGYVDTSGDGWKLTAAHGGPATTGSQQPLRPSVSHPNLATAVGTLMKTHGVSAKSLALNGDAVTILSSQWGSDWLKKYMSHIEALVKKVEDLGGKQAALSDADKNTALKQEFGSDWALAYDNAGLDTNLFFPTTTTAAVEFAHPTNSKAAEGLYKAYQDAAQINYMPGPDSLVGLILSALAASPGGVDIDALKAATAQHPMNKTWATGNPADFDSTWANALERVADKTGLVQPSLSGDKLELTSKGLAAIKGAPQGFNSPEELINAAMAALDTVGYGPGKNSEAVIAALAKSQGFLSLSEVKAASNLPSKETVLHVLQKLKEIGWASNTTNDNGIVLWKLTPPDTASASSAAVSSPAADKMLPLAPFTQGGEAWASLLKVLDSHGIHPTPNSVTGSLVRALIAAGPGGASVSDLKYTAITNAITTGNASEEDDVEDFFASAVDKLTNISGLAHVPSASMLALSTKGLQTIGAATAITFASASDPKLLALLAAGAMGKPIDPNSFQGQVLLALAKPYLDGGKPAGVAYDALASWAAKEWPGVGIDSALKWLGDKNLVAAVPGNPLKIMLSSYAEAMIGGTAAVPVVPVSIKWAPSNDKKAAELTKKVDDWAISFGKDNDGNSVKPQSYAANDAFRVLVGSGGPVLLSELEKTLDEKGYTPVAVNKFIEYAQQIGLITLHTTTGGQAISLSGGSQSSGAKAAVGDAAPLSPVTDPVVLKLLNKLGLDGESEQGKVVRLLHAMTDNGEDGVWTSALQGEASKHGIPNDAVDAVLAGLKALGHAADDGGFSNPVIYFYGKKAKPGAGKVAVVPAAAEPPAPPTASLAPVPKAADLTFSQEGSAAGLEGAGKKSIWKDKAGSQWLFKPAIKKGSSEAKPMAAYAQEFFSNIARHAKPNHLPIGTVTLKGQFGTIQPLLQVKGNLGGPVPPQNLTPKEMADVAVEHVIDWVTSQHDTHGANLLRMPDGSIVGVDKEQGFRFFPNDKLSVDYHPNEEENPPYYNVFWKAFRDGKINFDPKAMADAIQGIEAIPDDEYSAALKPYAAARSSSKADQEDFVESALERKHNLRTDFEKFLTDLHKQRFKENGKFTFEDGWTTASSGDDSAGAGAAVLQKASLSDASQKLGVAASSVYYPALEALAVHGGDVQKAIAALTTASPNAAALHQKRVKYISKKLAEAGISLATPEVPQTGPLKIGVKPSLALFGPNKPTAKGAVGVLTPAMVYPEGHAQYEAPKPFKPPTPPGYAEPPAGKMWEIMKGSTKVAQHFHKMKWPKDASGSEDKSSPNGLLKLKNIDAEGAKELLKKLGVTPIQGLLGKPLFNQKGEYTLVVVNREEWKQKVGSLSETGGVSAADFPGAAKTDFATLVDIPPPPPPPGEGEKFHATPKAGELKNPTVEPNLDDMKTLHENKSIGYGYAFHVGGAAVEALNMSAQRHIDEDGKEFYRFDFKLREPVWRKFKGGSQDEFVFNRTTYDEAKDAWVYKGSGDHDTDKHMMQQWKDGDSRFSIGMDAARFAYRGQVFADVYPKASETPMEAFARLLDKVNPGLSGKVLKNPTPQERELYLLAALHWSVAPQDHDKMPESDRTIENFKTRLKKKGYSETDFANLGFEIGAMDRVVPVLKGRAQKLKAQHGLSYITVGISNPANALHQMLSGTIGITQRLKHGIPCPVSGMNKNTSSQEDQETGGADYVYANVRADKSSWPQSNWGHIIMVYDLSELDRLDVFQHQSDDFGCTDPNNGSHGHSWKSRTTLEGYSPASCSEVCFRRGIGNRKLLKIICHQGKDNKTGHSQSADWWRQKVIDEAKKQGITEVNGMKLEDLVLVSQGGKPFMKTQLEPAGY